MNQRFKDFAVASISNYPVHSLPPLMVSLSDAVSIGGRHVVGSMNSSAAVCRLSVSEMYSYVHQLIIAFSYGESFLQRNFVL